MATERLLNFPVKASPVLADILYCGDSASSDLEVQITIQALINVYPTLTALGIAPLVANTYFYLDSAAAGAVGTITPLAVTLLADTTTTSMLTTLTALGLAGGTMTGAINMGSHQINAMTDPTSAQDAATKNYVDSAVGGAGTVTSIIAGTGLTGGTITTSGTIALANPIPSGFTWNGNVIGGAFGGTGVNNGSNTLTMAGNVTFAGAFGVTITSTATTNATLPAGTTTLVPTTGTGASGTWAISISGAAATAANLTGLTASTLYGNPTGSTATGQGITLGAGLAFSGTTLVATGLSSSLTSAHIFVGNGSNVATDVALSGDGTLSNTGTLTIASIGGQPVSLAGSFTLTGAFTTAFTVTANTALTLPTTGTLATTSQLPTLPLSLANGGTGQNLSSISVPAMFYMNGSNVFTSFPLSGGAVIVTNGSAVPLQLNSGTVNAVLQLKGAGTTPAYTPYSFPSAALTNGGILFANSTTSISQITPVNNSILGTNSGGTPSFLTSVNNAMLVTNGSGVPSLVAPINQTLASGSAVALVNNTAKDVIVVSGLVVGSKWIAMGGVTFVSNTGTCSFASAWVSAVSVTQPDSSLSGQTTSISTANNDDATAKPQILTVGAGGNLFLSCLAGFTVGLSACGSIVLIPT